VVASEGWGGGGGGGRNTPNCFIATEAYRHSGKKRGLVDNLVYTVSLYPGYSLFSCGHHFPKLQISNPTEGVVSSDTI